MRQLLFFSNNKNKIIEIKKIFKKFNLELLSLNDLNISEEPEESGQTFEENAKIKSDYGFNKTGIPCFADDSGICIESLNWKPGVLSKRFLNNFKSNEACFESIIKSTKKNSKLNAYFKTSISLTIKKGQFDPRVKKKKKFSLKKYLINHYLVLEVLFDIQDHPFLHCIQSKKAHHL